MPGSRSSERSNMNDTLTETDIVKIQDILIEQLDVKRDQLTPQALLDADLGADSLDKVEIVMSIEEALSVTVPDEEAEKVQTVEDLYEAVGTLLGRGEQ